MPKTQDLEIPSAIKWSPMKANGRGAELPWPVVFTDSQAVEANYGHALNDKRRVNGLFLDGYKSQFGEAEIDELIWCGFAARHVVSVAATFGDRRTTHGVPTSVMENPESSMHNPSLYAFQSGSDYAPGVVALRGSALNKSPHPTDETLYWLKHETPDFDSAVAGLMIIRGEGMIL